MTWLSPAIYSIYNVFYKNLAAVSWAVIVVRQNHNCTEKEATMRADTKVIYETQWSHMNISTTLLKSLQAGVLSTPKFAGI